MSVISEVQQMGEQSLVRLEERIDRQFERLEASVQPIFEGLSEIPENPERGIQHAVQGIIDPDQFIIPQEPWHFPQVPFSVEYFTDPFSQATTFCFGHPLIEKLRILSVNNGLTIAKTPWKITLLFYRIFSYFFRIPRYEAYLDENRRTLTQYRNMIIRECGVEKLNQIELDYRFNLNNMIREGAPLQASLVQKINIGMNMMEMQDVQRLLEHMRALPQSVANIQGIPLDMPLRQFFITYENQLPLTRREMKGILNVIGQEESVADFLADFQNLPRLAEDLDIDRFTELADMLQTPQQYWNNIFTGRPINKIITGAYHDAPWGFNLRPWLDDQELLHVVPELVNSPTEEVFNELLVKTVIKKQPFRYNDQQGWRAGCIIPAPTLDGRRRYLRVDEGVDSGLGKYWLTLKPACNQETTLNTIRLYRDTSVSPYMQGGGGTLIRDLCFFAPVGYIGNKTTAIQDRQFFKTATAPTWIVYFLEALKFQRENPQDEATLRTKLQRCLELSPLPHPNLYSIEEIKNHLNHLGEEMGELRNFELLNKIKGSLSILGNSLGAFDAQYDFVHYTADQNRLPIVPVKLYVHSGVRVKDQDDERFTNFIQPHLNILQNLGSKLDFDYVFEIEKDRVPEVGSNHTYLGKRLSQHPHAAVSAKIRPYRVNPHARSRVVLELAPHFKRLEAASLMNDVFRIPMSFQDFDNIAARRWSEVLRIIIGFPIFCIFSCLFMIKRIFKSRRGMSWRRPFDTVRVQYTPTGSVSSYSLNACC